MLHLNCNCITVQSEIQLRLKLFHWLYCLNGCIISVSTKILLPFTLPSDFSSNCQRIVVQTVTQFQFQLKYNCSPHWWTVIVFSFHFTLKFFISFNDNHCTIGIQIGLQLELKLCFNFNCFTICPTVRAKIVSKFKLQVYYSLNCIRVIIFSVNHNLQFTISTTNVMLLNLGFPYTSNDNWITI